MLTFDEAIALLDEAVSPLTSETVKIEHAAERYLAEDLHARTDAPRSDVSAMDGYAVIERTTVPGNPYKVVGEARPGMPYPRTLQEGEVLRIFTGAPVPQGADCVIMQEYATSDGEHVTFAEGFGPARHIRKAGGDFREGDLLLARGSWLTPRAMVTAAAADRDRIEVYRQPKVAIIATGEELVTPGNAHATDAGLPESASFGVSAMCGRMGAQVIMRARGRDDLDELAGLASEAISSADLVVVTGGASVGDHDLARPMFADIGLDLVFSRIAIKPGKPVWLGRAGGKLVLGLPGNPTSAMVTARLFLCPLLARLQGGAIADQLGFLPMLLAGPLDAVGSRETFVRAASTQSGLQPADNQESGAQAPLATSDWLIRRPANSPAIAAGGSVQALPF
ncbi:molybdopterin molybdotransferase MoeA [Qipengyuania sphaerica]|uniref:molybdopterin molybdotransferase MoeA n=1 Tax=Qipengyuania sphaerica TaxID=2867243 RepID=UPI001C887792|nr:molybdopterin molybdotransferase MoeA [Qipengyuania sphaerica]